MDTRELFKSICDRHHGRFTRMAANWARTYDLEHLARHPEDLVQESYCVGLERLDQLDPDEDRIAGYIARTLERLVLQARRDRDTDRRVYEKAALAGGYASSFEPADALERIGLQEFEEKLQSIMTDSMARHIAEIVEAGDADIRVVAEKHGISESKVRRHRQQIRQFLDQHKIDALPFARLIGKHITHRSWEVRKEREAELCDQVLQLFWLARIFAGRGKLLDSVYITSNKDFVELKRVRPYYAVIALGWMFRDITDTSTLDIDRARQLRQAAWLFGTALIRFFGLDNIYPFINRKDVVPVAEPGQEPPDEDLGAYIKMAQIGHSLVAAIELVRHEGDMPSVLRDPFESLSKISRSLETLRKSHCP